VQARLIRWLLRSGPHETQAVRLPPGDGQHVLVTGGTGFIGRPLVTDLLRHGYRVTVFTRDPARAASAGPASARYVAKFDDIARDDPIDLMVNLAGESLNAGRWNAARKQRLIASRVETTARLYAHVAGRTALPRALVNGSAIGWYGPRADDRRLDESAEPVPSFSHELCRRWEEEAARFADLGIRVCYARFGAVLGRYGGALRELAKSYAFGASVTLGRGDQYLSWIHLDDLLNAIGHVLTHDELAGPLNFTAPEPVTNAAFAAALRNELRAPLRMRLPAAVLRAMLGEMADELLLSGQRVVPARLQQSGFVFAFPTLDAALHDLLCEPAQRAA
jgi:uncharacterized protein